MNRPNPLRAVLLCALALGVATSVAIGQSTTPTTAAPPSTATTTVPGDYEPADIPNTNTFEEDSTTVAEDDPNSTGGAGGNQDPDGGDEGTANLPGSNAGGLGPGEGALPSSLASTGTDPMVPIGIGLALIALSSVAIVWRRRRSA